MAFENNGLSAADMAAVLRNNGGGFGGDNSNGWWIILFLLLAMCGGWGNWGGGGTPAQTVAADVQRGFDQSATTSQIANLQSQVGNGFADAAVSTCQGNANITSAITNGQYATAQAINGAKDTLGNTLNGLAMSLQNSCCENRAGLADLKYTVATENCQDRQALSDGLRDLMAQNTANTQAIVNSQTQGFQNVLDKLCQMELDNLKSENQNLRTQLNMAGLAASQTAQTAQLIQDNNAQTQALIQRIAPAPIPSYPVANPNGCGLNYGCGA